MGRIGGASGIAGEGRHAKDEAQGGEDHFGGGLGEHQTDRLLSNGGEGKIRQDSEIGP